MTLVKPGSTGLETQSMAASSGQRGFGLHEVFPKNDATSTTIDIIAIHGLGTESPRTWVFKRNDGRDVNWLEDGDMLPAATPDARIFTYDWDANHFEDAPIGSLRGHADTLLALVNQIQSSETRPLIFVAFCFGGLVLAEALNRANQTTSPYRQVLLSTVGIVFLATPFRGSDAAKEARWQMVVGGILGNKTSVQLVDALNNGDRELRNLTKSFAEAAYAPSVRLPIHCFYERKKTKILRHILSPGLASMLSTRFTYKILVSESSACLDGASSHGLDATHFGMNKFASPEDGGFQLVRNVIQAFAKDASSVVRRRIPIESHLGLRPFAQNRNSTHWLVPLEQNQHFVGRESVLRQLLERADPHANMKHCQRTAVVGLGGVGKTQIALEAAYRIRDEHPGCSVFWVPAIHATSFENAYRDIGRKLQVNGIDDDNADVKKLVKAALGEEAAGTWFLVVDSADDSKLLFDNTTSSLAQYLPSSKNGSILFTTRTREVAVDLVGPSKDDILPIGGMSDDEARELLEKGLQDKQIHDAASTTSLLDFLANLPLALKQASAYMAKTGITTTKYLEYCRSSSESLIKLLSKDFEDRTRYKETRNPVATTWLISFDHILRDNQLATAYLKYLCFLAEKDIPRAMLSLADDEMEADEAIGVLIAYAFLTERDDSSSYDMHRLVQIAARNWLKIKGEWQECATKALWRVADVFPFPEHENRHTWTKYLPHAQHILQFWRDIADCEAKRDLMTYVGVAFRRQGKYAEAEAMHRKGLDLREKALGRDHPSTLSSMNSLANVLRSQGKYAEAEAMHRNALDLREKVLGRDHPSTLDSMNNLANVLGSQGKYAGAEAIHRNALNLKEKALGRDHSSTLNSLNNLANVLRCQGKYAEAEAMHRDALDLFEKALGRDHPSTLDSMNNLANVLYSQGKYAEAEAMHREVLDLRGKALGRDHPSTLSSMNNLANILYSQGKHTEAEAMHRKAFSLKEKALGCDHPSTLDSMNNLANVLDSQGKYAEAEAMHRKALSLKEQALGRDHPSTLDSMNNLANMLHSQGKYAEAEAMHRDTLDLRERSLGHDHPSTLNSLNNLANVLGSQGKHAEAETIYRDTLDLFGKALGHDHPSTLNSLDNLANVLGNQFKYAEAEAIHRKALSLKEKVLGRDHPSTLESINNLAKTLRGQGKDAETEAVTNMVKKEVAKDISTIL